MKIAINALCIHKGITGIGNYARSLVNSLIEFDQNNNYLLLQGKECPGILSVNGRENFEQLIVGAPSYLWEQLHLPSDLAVMGVDLYHSPLFSCPIVDEVPSVITIHDVIPEVKPELCSKGFLEFYRRCIYSSARAAFKIITTSQFSKDEIVKCLGVSADKVHVVYQGISSEFSINKKKISSR